MRSLFQRLVRMSKKVEYSWFEVYVEEESCPPYILVLLGGDQGFAIVDPVEKNRVAYQPSSYEDARNWLSEDEFSPVTGRVDYEFPRPQGC